MAKITAIVSGGLDSTTMLYRLRADGHEIIQTVSFNYGQRHKKELQFAVATSSDLHIPWTCIDLFSAGLTEALLPAGSSLLSQTRGVPEGHYAEENMKSTVVPNRNMIMIALAGGIAVANGSNQVALGVHAGDHFIYPDCRPDFIKSVGQALYDGNEGFGKLSLFSINTPYIYHTKADIAYDAIKLGVPIERTWSCYKGGDIHCGRCGTCVERLEAIHEAQERMSNSDQVKSYDTTEYEDSKYWQTVTA